MPSQDNLAITINATEDSRQFEKGQRLMRFKARMAALQARPRQLSKHTHDFEYKRHTAVFAGYGDNLREYRHLLADLHAKKEKGEHIEIHQPKVWISNGQLCYSVRYFTRKLIGEKRHALSNPANP